eukprot:9485985-Pyramimonas_sp.AAC.2
MAERSSFEDLAESVRLLSSSEPTGYKKAGTVERVLTAVGTCALQAVGGRAHETSGHNNRVAAVCCPAACKVCGGPSCSNGSGCCVGRVIAGNATCGLRGVTLPCLLTGSDLTGAFSQT